MSGFPRTLGGVRVLAGRHHTIHCTPHPSIPPPFPLHLPPSPVGSQSVNMQVTDTGGFIVERDIPGESTALDEVAAVLQCCTRTGTARHLVPHRNHTRAKHLRIRRRKSNPVIGTICLF